MIKDITHEEMDISDQIQRDCIEMVRYLMETNPRVTHQDATNVYLYNKIAQLELRILKLETKNNDSKIQ